MYGICNVSLAPVRKEADDRSEMVTQLLFGETFEVIGKQKQWRKIVTTSDSYEGWIDEKQFAELSLKEIETLKAAPETFTIDLVQLAVHNATTMLPLLIGSRLPAYMGHTFTVGETPYTFDGHVKTVDHTPAMRSGIVETAYVYINAPYLWGGKSPFGIDCSGFTQMVYKLNGITLKRDANQQAEQGETLSFIAEAQPGDLAFFDNEEGRITHVGIVLSNSKIIHASGKVRIDNLDQHGIYNEDKKTYTHKLRVIKKLV